MGTVIENATWKARVIATATGPKVSTPAEPFVRRMAEVTDADERLFLACRALRRDEDCIEANLIVAAAQGKRKPGSATCTSLWRRASAFGHR